MSQNFNNDETITTDSNTHGALLILYAIGNNGSLVPYAFNETGNGTSQMSITENSQQKTEHSLPLVRESVTPPLRRYLSFKLAANFVPSFDGKTPSVHTFFRTCQIANEAVHPGDKPFLKTLIRNKITGNANLYLQNNYEPDSLTSLIDTLKSVFSPKRNLSQLQAKMSNMVQKEDESVMQYGIRTSESSSSILDTIEEHFPQEVVVGMRLGAIRKAVSCFFRGLRLRSKQKSDSSPRFHPYIKDNTRNKSDCRYDRKIEEQKTRESNPRSSKAPHISFTCGQPGHFKRDCPKQNNLHPVSKAHRVVGCCAFCNGPNHYEENCLAKKKNEIHKEKNFSRGPQNGSRRILYSRSSSLAGEDPVILLDGDLFLKGRAEFLIDTGSKLNLIKENAIKSKLRIKRNRVYNLMGIGKGGHQNFRRN